MSENNKIIALAKRIKIKIDLKDITLYQKELNLFKKDVNLLKTINVDNLKPFHRPGEIIKINNVKQGDFKFSKKQIYNNYPSKKDNYLVIHDKEIKK